MKGLRELYIYYCYRLTQDIDLTHNPEVTYALFQRGNSSSNVRISTLFPENSKIKAIYLDYPRELKLINPVNISPSSTISFYGSSGLLEDINFTNIPNGKSFNLLSKIMGWGIKS